MTKKRKRSTKAAFRNTPAIQIPVGRPRSFIDPLKQKNLLDGLSTGLPIERACDFAGVSARTVFRLLNKFSTLQESAEKMSLVQYGTEEYWLEFIPNEITPGGWNVREEAAFCQAIKNAIASFHARCCASMEKPPKGSHWQAFATKLERRDPDNWARRDIIQGDAENPLRFVKVVLPDNGRGPKAGNQNDKRGTTEKGGESA